MLSDSDSSFTLFPLARRYIYRPSISPSPFPVLPIVYILTNFYPTRLSKIIHMMIHLVIQTILNIGNSLNHLASHKHVSSILHSNSHIDLLKQPSTERQHTHGQHQPHYIHSCTQHSVQFKHTISPSTRALLT